MQEKHNKDKVYIIPAIQNYLKRSVKINYFQMNIIFLKFIYNDKYDIICNSFRSLFHKVKKNMIQEIDFNIY